MTRRRRGRGMRRYRRNPVFGNGGPTRAFKEFISKDNLTIAGGAVVGNLLTNYIVKAFGPVKEDGTPKADTDFVLPGLRPGTDGKISPYPVIAYSAVLPLGATLLARKFSPSLSKGLMIGGAVALIQNVIVLIQQRSQAAQTNGATQATSAYLRRGTIRALPGSPPGYSAVRAFGGALDNSNAFKGAWNR